MHSKDENSVKVDEKYTDSSVNIALDTIRISKQAIFFVSTKPSAEKLAEEISRKIDNIDLKALSEEIENTLEKPTAQCRRLAACVKRGIAFHHAGLHSGQRELIEDNFRKGDIKIICSTPTLAAGVDLPAFRAVIRDLKRFSGSWGMADIPVLEYQQMAGRAGRPSFDPWGEAITIAKSDSEKDDIYERYITADSEDIYSKLAVEPVLRIYILSLIASRFVSTKQEIFTFFEKTFWAYQYKDMQKMETIIDKMLEMLEDWEFITSGRKHEDFVSADSLNDDSKYKATALGQRVAELYLDPYTAHSLVTAMNNSVRKKVVLFSILQMVSNTLEMRPQLSVRTKEYDTILSAAAKYEDNLLFVEPSGFDMNYDDYLASIKTALFMQEWCEETDEEMLLEKYNIRPGEIRVKLDIGDWLIYSSIEIAKLLDLGDFVKELMKARIRLQYGAKEELMPLLKLKGIGRVRARKLFAHGIKTIGDVKKSDLGSLSQLLGKAVALAVKEQLDQPLDEPISENKRKGQMSIGKYGE